MGTIKLIPEDRERHTSVSNFFIDQMMPKANGEFVKVYIYLLRCCNAPNSEISISAIADHLDHTEKDVLRALTYWDQIGMLRLGHSETGALTSIELSMPKTSFVGASVNTMGVHNKANNSRNALHDATVSVSVTKLGTDTLPGSANITVPGTDTLSGSANITVPGTNTLPGSANITVPGTNTLPGSANAANKTATREKHTYTPDESMTLMEKDEVAQFMYITEKYFGRPLSKSENNTLLYLYDGLSFSGELIEYLIEYCVSKNHTSIHYIEKTALAWAEKNITTVEEAKKDSNLFNQQYYSVMNAFGLSGRNPGQPEKDYICKWTSEYGFTLDIIVDACNRTIQSIHQPSFEYADSILSRWKKRGIKVLSDVQVLDNEHATRKNMKSSNSAAPKASPKNSFASFQQNSYDFDELERTLIANNKGGN